MRIINKIILTSVMTLTLAACAHQEKMVLGVPQSVWTQLSPSEQQQFQTSYAASHVQN